MDAPRSGPTAGDRVGAALAAVGVVQPTVNAFVHRLDEHARARAAELVAAQGAGALRGVPMAVKDLIDVEGAATTGGCLAYRDNVADRHAPVVAALEAAGAVAVAKTNLHELGAGATGTVSLFGPTYNPWDPDRIAGGSSSGSAAAVAAGVVPLALGTDTGGSVRIPASFCGVTGLKPTPGRVPLAGVLPMSTGFDTVGPLAVDAVMCAQAFAAMVIDRPRVVPAAPVDGFRIGLPAPYFTLLHADTARGVRDASATFDHLGADVSHRDGPGLDEDAAGFGHVWSDLAHSHRELVGSGLTSPQVARLLDMGFTMDADDVIRSRRRASEMRVRMLTALETVDALLVPATPYPAPRADADEVEVQGGSLDVHRGGPSRFTYVVNEAGLPAVAFPVGHSAEGLPIGAQLIGRPKADEHLLAVVTAFQQATSHHRRHPPLHVGGRHAADARRRRDW